MSGRLHSSEGQAVRILAGLCFLFLGFALLVRPILEGIDAVAKVDFISIWATWELVLVPIGVISIIVSLFLLLDAVAPDEYQGPGPPDDYLDPQY